MNRPIVFGSLLVAVAASLFGTLGIVSRLADEEGIGAFAFVFWRGALATTLLVGVIAGGLALRRTAFPHPRLVPPRKRALLLVACLAGATLNIAMFVAFLRTEIAVVLIVFYTFPAMVTLAAVRLYGERLDLIRGGALILASAGLALVLLGPALESGRLDIDAIGVGLALLAAVCQAAFILVSARGFAPFHAIHVGTYVIAAAAITALPLALLAGDPAALVQPFVDGAAWPWLLAGGITGAAIPTTLLLTGMRVIGPSRTAILMTFEPVVGVALAGLLLAETPVPLQLAGGAAVLVAAAILQAGPREGPRAVPEEGEYQQVV
ncbi:MAG TPA: DMT family transporter [Candidatus Limnocylindrales bacterium]|nr:DMT family transporter [Candidatus Limnocylindrales bacterium]